MAITTQIIVPTYDRPDDLHDCLESIQEYTKQGTYEITVVDSGKPPSNCQHDYKFTYLQTPPNIGFSRAINTGAANCKTDFLVWLNDDCVVRPDWLKSMLDFMQAEKSVGIGVFFFSDAHKSQIGKVMFYQNEVFPNFGCIRREVWNKLKGFDEQYYSYGAETDIGFRCKKLGIEVRQASGAHIYHKCSKDDARKHHVVQMGKDFEQLRLKTRGPELKNNLYWMDELGHSQTHLDQINHRNENGVGLTQLGTYYGTHFVDLACLNRNSIVYSVGIGEDNSFDMELIKIIGCTIHAFDPTPRSIKWVAQQSLPSQFIFHNIGISSYDGPAKFFPPKNSLYVSHSIIQSETTATNQAIIVQFNQLSTIMKKLGHTKIDLLKLDIEGAEYNVIDNICKHQIFVKQICMEVHKINGIDIQHKVEKLIKSGFSVFNNKGNEFTFLNEKTC